VTISRSLCFPDRNKSCFACCPPIRPPGYEHLEYKNIIKRILRENSRNFDRQDETIIPITGFSCWALGYIGEGYNQIGCLLHPAQNNGVELRHRTDYGKKCQREYCQEERIFSCLEESVKEFWLHLADGMDSFEYSSREKNPLFRILSWGPGLLTKIAKKEYYSIYSQEGFFQTYPFFSTPLSPKGNAYPVNYIVEKKGTEILKEKSFGKRYKEFISVLKRRVKEKYCDNREGVHVHLLKIERAYSDFLRLSIQIKKAILKDAIGVKEIVDKEMDGFCEEIN
jgi:hypothetical protein